jgi:hypothetical protein
VFEVAPYALLCNFWSGRAEIKQNVGVAPEDIGDSRRQFGMVPLTIVLSVRGFSSQGGNISVGLYINVK